MHAERTATTGSDPEQKPKPNVRVTLTLDLYWPELETEQMGVGPSLTDDCHDAVANAVHVILEAGDPNDDFNMGVWVRESKPLPPDDV